MRLLTRSEAGLFTGSEPAVKEIITKRGAESFEIQPRAVYTEYFQKLIFIEE